MTMMKTAFHSVDFVRVDDLKNGAKVGRRRHRGSRRGVGGRGRRGLRSAGYVRTQSYSGSGKVHYHMGNEEIKALSGCGSGLLLLDGLEGHGLIGLAALVAAAVAGSVRTRT